MANFFQNFYFTSDAFNIFLVVYLFLLKYFYCNLKIQTKPELTFSPVNTCVPYFTSPKVPLPRALPKFIK